MTDATAIAAWDPASGAALPAYLAEAMGDMGSNIADRNSVPSLSYEGKTWQIIKDGNRTKMQAANADGDVVPIPVMRVVVLNFNNDRGRAYYEGVYNPAASTAPKCWSPDGKAPDPSVKEKMNAVCTTCPMSVKGSKVQDGKEMVACGSHRMIAVVPGGSIDTDPLRLKIAVTSDYDKEIVEHGWYAFRQYVDYLKSRGIVHTAMCITKIKFDPNAQYPKLLFALDRVLTQDEVGMAQRALANPKVQELLSERWTAAGSAGTASDESDIKPFGLEGAYADGWQAHPDSPGWSWKGKDVISNTDLAARYPEPKAPPAPVEAAPAIPASQMVVENQQQAADPAPAVVEKPAEPAPAVAAYDPLVAAMADGWAVHPDNPAYYFKGEQVVATADVMAKYPAPEAVAPVAPAAPPAPPAAPPVVHHDALATATADGWADHPTAPGWMFKGEQVLQVADVEALYPAPNGSTPAGSTASAGTVETATTGQAATTAASPSDAGVPADVKDLLAKWSE